MGEGHVPPQNLGYQLILFGPRGPDYVCHIDTGPLIFLDDAASLREEVRKKSIFLSLNVR